LSLLAHDDAVLTLTSIRRRRGLVSACQPSECRPRPQSDRRIVAAARRASASAFPVVIGNDQRAYRSCRAPTRRPFSSRKMTSSSESKPAASQS